jgi:quercetin dioxygenase-like cupin family protein
MVLVGEVDLILPAAPFASGDPRRRLRAGQFVYYPAHFPHTLETVSAEPANYLMFKWCTGKTENAAPLGFGQFDVLDSLKDPHAHDGFCPRILFAGPTAYLRKLQCHTSTLTAGAGYDPHVDAYDVAMIILEGEVETLGERVAAHNVIFYPAGEPHGIRNPGHVTAKYVVFEFHGSQTKLDDSLPLSKPPSRLARLKDPKAVKRRLKRLARNVRERLSPSEE